MPVSSDDDDVPGVIKVVLHYLRIFKKKSIGWLARHPRLAAPIVVTFILVCLPAVMVMALTPIAFLFNYIGNIFTANGILTIYSIAIKGFLIALLIGGTVMGVFFFLTCLGLLKSVQRPRRRKK